MYSNFISSYDTRTSSNQAHRWQDSSLDSRAFFRTLTEPSTLSIDNIGEKEEGEYRCRIDYLRSPTKNLRVKLTVIGESELSDIKIFIIYMKRTV